MFVLKVQNTKELSEDESPDVWSRNRGVVPVLVPPHVTAVPDAVAGVFYSLYDLK